MQRLLTRQTLTFHKNMSTVKLKVIRDILLRQWFVT